MPPPWKYNIYGDYMSKSFSCYSIVDDHFIFINLYLKCFHQKFYIHISEWIFCSFSLSTILLFVTIKKRKNNYYIRVFQWNSVFLPLLIAIVPFFFIYCSKKEILMIWDLYIDHIVVHCTYVDNFTLYKELNFAPKSLMIGKHNVFSNDVW